MNEEIKLKIIDVIKRFLKDVLMYVVACAVVIFILQKIFVGSDIEQIIEYAVKYGIVIVEVRGVFALIHIALILFGASATEKKLKKEYFSDIISDYDESLEYYKDVFNLGSPMISVYINEPNKINVINKDVFAAGLMHLIDKGNVQVRNGELEVDDPDVSLNCEKYLIEKIRDGRFDMGNEKLFYQELKRQIAKDAVEKMKLLEKNKPNKRNGVMILLGLLISVAVGACFGEDSWGETIADYAILIFALYGMRYLFTLSNLKTTNKGSQINSKIEGLKKYFLKSYDVLGQKNDEELMSQYAFHLVAFGHNPKVVEEYMKFVDITPNLEK